MYATEIDKVRKKIVRNGFKPRDQGSNLYYTVMLVGLRVGIQLQT